jgi:hypothetical protein
MARIPVLQPPGRQDAVHANFDDGEITDLTYSAATWIASGRAVHALRLDGACAILPSAVAV